ncbi:hypothetical protein Salat_1331400 [Sesamum alatum]|uniref:Uncharacterized protein n=1 Tax=Sesamum alatum TaxID=300844 RepID=A0AAE2CQ30_9LAMI|nr:hypothetical protein Salat_1331400 [Sesamum alatum]
MLDNNWQRPLTMRELTCCWGPDWKFLVSTGSGLEGFELGSIQGDILIISPASMRVQTFIRNARMGLVTELAFSQHSRALVSASLDSSTWVTLIKDKKGDSMNGSYLLY